jgi:hypothetical protein
MRTALALMIAMATAATATARPPPECEYDDPGCEPRSSRARPLVEWSTWLRLGFGVAPAEPDTAARATMPPAPVEQASAWEAALGAEVTLPITDSGNLRVGPWLEARGTTIVAGGQLALTAVPRSIDMFFYRGSGILALRVGGNTERGTAALAYGYLAPWKLWGPWSGATRYMIGVRFVGTVTRAYGDPRDWAATFGLEFEPVGAIRYLLGIRSWY